MRRVIQLGLGFVVSLATILGLSTAAHAHHNTVSGSAACADDGYIITWQVVNSESDKTEAASLSVDVGTLSQSSVTIGDGGTATVTSTAPEGTTSVTLTANGVWENEVTNTAYGAVTDFPEGCEAPEVEPEPEPEPQPEPTPEPEVIPEPEVVVETHFDEPEVVEQSTTTTDAPEVVTEAPAVPRRELARTGLSLGVLTFVALGLATAGLALVKGARRCA